jgi:TRAP transporter 4TM/12TM fusion protein
MMEGTDRQLLLKRWIRPAGDLAGGLIMLGAIFWGLDMPTRLGLLVYTEQFLAAVLALVFFIAYFRDGTYGFFSHAAGLVGLCSGAWLAWRYPVLQADVLSHPVEAMMLSSVLLVLLVDACRRSVGFPLTIVFGFFFLYAFAGPMLPGLFETKAISITRLLPYLAFDTSSMPGPALSIACTTVILFMFFGRVLQASGGAQFFNDVSMSLFGRYRGGPGKVEVCASALFGTISGSAVANTMSTGVITIPNMKRFGYPAVMAGAIEAVSSTGGQIMPPVMGAAAFLMAETLQVRYATVALAAMVPALLYYISIFLQVDYEAARRHIGGLDPATLPRIRQVLRDGWLFFVPFGVMFYCMLWLNMEAEPSVLIGAAALAPFAARLGYRGERLTWRGLVDATVATGRESVDIVVVCAIAGCVIGLLNITGFALGMSISLVHLGEQSLPLLLVVVALISVVLGMGLPTTGVYLLVAVLAAPALVKLGVPALAAHMFVFFYGCLSMITPPVAMAAYAAAHIAKASPMQVGWTACRLGWPAFVLPFVFVGSPSLLFVGEAAQIALTVVAAMVGVWLVSAAIGGFLFEHLSIARRLLAAAVGLTLFLPGEAYAGALAIQLAGLPAAAILIWYDWRRAAKYREGWKTV